MHKTILSLILGMLCCAWAAQPVPVKPPVNDMHAESETWTGFWNLPQRNRTLVELLQQYGEPSMVGKGAILDFTTPDEDTIAELYDLVFRDLGEPFRVLRYEWPCGEGKDLVLFFPSADPSGKPLGGYLYDPLEYGIAERFRKTKYYSPRNWDHEEGCIHWDTITKSQDWVSFRYFADKDLNPDTISKKLGKPRWIETGKDAKWGMYYSTYRLEGMYSQSFAKYPEDSITLYTWKTEDYFYLEIYYINTENGDSAITGCFQSSMVLPE